MTNKIGPVFVSYANQGTGAGFLELCEEIVGFSGLDVDIWTDRKIEAGNDWQDQIESALNQASAAILLVDWKFVMSQYIQNKELPHFLTRAAGLSDERLGESHFSPIPIIPILVESCPYEDVMPWLNTLQMEPERSLRARFDPQRTVSPDLLTLVDLPDNRLAQFKTALTKRLGTTRVRASGPAPTRHQPAQHQPPRTEERSESRLKRYLTRGEDLSGNYVDLQLNLVHSEFNTYRVELRLGYRDGRSSHRRVHHGLWCCTIAAAQETTAATQADGHPSFQDLLDTRLWEGREASVYRTTDGCRHDDGISVASCLAEANDKARELLLPLQIHLGINTNAGELHELPWETLPLVAGAAVGRADNVLFTRCSLTAGEDAVECQTRAHTALRVLSVYSDIGIPALDGGDPARQRAIQARMDSCIKVLAWDQAASKSLLRPDPEILFHHLTMGTSFDVLYLVCEGVKRGGEYYLRLQNRDLSRAELACRFRATPVPSLVILAPAHQLEGSASQIESLQALAQFTPLLARLGAASVLSCQQSVPADTWERFLKAFFTALNSHGHVPGAVQEARAAELGDEHWWKPTLLTRIKATRLWYEPGFVSDEAPETNWESLRASVNSGRFCPVLGPGVYYRLQQARLTLARELADEYDYPLSFSHRINLPAVYQYVRTLCPTTGVFLNKIEEKIRNRLSETVEQGQVTIDNANTRTLSDFATAVARETLSSEQDNPYNILARLPIELYLNTNLDPFMEAALALASNADARDDAYLFDLTQVDPERADFTGASTFQRGEFDPRHPVVLQLHGTYKDLARATLGEDDFFQFLATFGDRMKDIEGPLAGKLKKSDLVFLGFKWNSLSFHVLFRALQKYADSMREDSFHIAVQVDPDDDETIHPGKALEYLRRYFAGGTRLQKAQFSIYWGSTGDFLRELESWVSGPQPKGGRHG